MRILLDMQGAQSESRWRGIGRHTLALAEAIVRNRGEHEIILVLSGLFPDTVEPIRKVFDGLLPRHHILIWYAPGPVHESSPENRRRRLAAELIREAFLASLNPDIVHVFSLFEGYVDDAVTSIGLFPADVATTASYYDLIPLMHPEAYLDPLPVYRDHYLRKVDYLGRCAGLLAISAFSVAEIERLRLVRSESAVINVSSACDGRFCPVEMLPAEQKAILSQYAIEKPFAMYAGAADTRKNLPRLIRAFARLPRGLRTSHQLVLVGRLPEGDIAALKQTGRSAGLLDKDVIFTGYAPDQDLVKLYNLCSVFVFPSLCEGFGLPALEAMQCGAPVIASNTSSLPEVIGRQDALFDPLDESCIAAKMQEVLENDSFRLELKRHSLAQAKRFSWDESARRSIGAFARFHSGAPEQEMEWRKIASILGEHQRQLVHLIADILHGEPGVTDDDIAACAQAIAQNVDSATRFHRRVVLPSHLSWRLEGPFDSSYSLAIVNRELAVAVGALGHTVALHSTDGGGDFTPDSGFLRHNPEIKRLWEHAASLTQDTVDVASRNLYPPRVADMHGRLNILHQYAWEESAFPQEWVEDFNEYLQGVGCVSRHVKKILIDNGVTVPLAVSGNGIDHWERIIPDTGYRVEGRAFRFLHVSSCFPRKGVDVLLLAYGRAFSQSDDVTLIIKTFKNPHNQVQQWLSAARAAHPNYPDVVIIEQDLTDGEIKALYEQCHALVAPSRAEGFGLPLAEAMLSGLPVITTGWGGQGEFCNEETAWIVDYRFKSADSHLPVFDSVWAEPDTAGVAEKMREVHGLSPEARKCRPAAGRQLLMARFRWRDVAARLIHASRVWSACEDLPRPRIGWVTTWNTRCGIATYSSHLISNMPTDVTVLAAETADTTAPDADNVVRCWGLEDHERLTKLRQKVQELGLNVVVFQFNYGFFNFWSLSECLLGLVNEGRTVFVMMHSTKDPASIQHKTLRSLAPALGKCQVLVHTAEDLERLKGLGLVHNVSILPHGIPDVIPGDHAQGRRPRQFTIASYGFFLPHKGLVELVEAVAVLRTRGFNVRLAMINAEYPTVESRTVIRSVRDKVSEKRLASYVDVCTDFLSDEESLERLAMADLVVYAYQYSSESSSAAVRHGIASGRPVLVSPLAIFDDVRPAVHYLAGQGVSDIVEGVSEFIRATRTGSSLMEDKERVAESWRAAHRYSKVSARLFGMIVGTVRDKQSCQVYDDLESVKLCPG